MDDRTPTAVTAAPPKPQTAVVAAAPPPRPRSRWIWLILLVLAAGAAYYKWPAIVAFFASSTPAPAAGKSKGGRGGGAVQVLAARAQRGTVHVYVTGLGAVTPIYTVTIKSRVDGQLMDVHFREGQIVHKGDPLVEIDPRPYQVQLDQAQGQLQHDEALLKNAHLDLDRYQVLYKQDAIPQQQLATQEALVTQYDGTIKTDQASIENARLNLVYCHITAPINGLVGLRLVDPGNIVHASDANGLLVITQLDPVSVIFTVSEDQLPPVEDKVHAGQVLGVEAWDREWKYKLAEGTLTTIDNQIDPTTGTLKLRADFANPNYKLYPSQFVNARLLIDTKRNVVVIPNAGLQRNSNGSYVWRLNPNRTVQVQPVTPGVVEGDQTEIVSGLEPGDAVVTVGIDRLEDGARVEAQIAGEQPSGGSGAGDSSGRGGAGGGRKSKKS